MLATCTWVWEPVSPLLPRALPVLTAAPTPARPGHCPLSCDHTWTQLSEPGPRMPDGHHSDTCNTEQRPHSIPRVAAPQSSPTRTSEEAVTSGTCFELRPDRCPRFSAVDTSCSLTVTMHIGTGYPGNRLGVSPPAAFQEGLPQDSRISSGVAPRRLPPRDCPGAKVFPLSHVCSF